MKRLLGLLALGFPHSCLLLVASELQGGGWGLGVCHHQAGETLLSLPVASEKGSEVLPQPLLRGTSPSLCQLIYLSLTLCIFSKET